MQSNEIEAKSALVPSKLPGTDYVVNPYIGCRFGCVYCYASFMGRFVGEPIERWGEYVFAKTNIVPVFAKELDVVRSQGQAPSIFLSSITDPYQGAEVKYQLTRGIIEVLSREPYPGEISILTKSPLVLRDIDLIIKLPDVEVGMTVTTTDDGVSRFLEVRAPSATQRLDALKKLHEAGLVTYAFVGPLLPHYRLQQKRLDALFAAIAATGVREVFVEQLNLKPYIRKRLMPQIAKAEPTIRACYAYAADQSNRETLRILVGRLLRKHKLVLKMDKVLDHGKDY